MASDTKTLVASCHCKNVHYSITVPTDSLPLQVHLCSCTVCRRTHGAPCCFHAPLPSDIVPEFIAPSSLDSLSKYAHSGAKSTRFFCTTCGCHVGDNFDDKSDWYISTSIFHANQDQKLFQIATHAFTLSAGDGGLSSILTQIDDRQIRIWNPPSDISAKEITTDTPNSKSTELVDPKDQLLAQCHCGGVSFQISRPSQDFVASSASHGWVHPHDSSKWLATVDVCDDCRLVTGTNVIMWLFVAKDHISPSLPADLLIGSSKSYVSSKGVLRTFCGTCGATVFYSHESRPGVVDVATGILRAPEGVMLENWAIWRTARVGYLDDGLKYDAGFARGLEEGLKQWGERTHGLTRDFVVGAETHP